VLEVGVEPTLSEFHGITSDKFTPAYRGVIPYKLLTLF